MRFLSVTASTFLHFGTAFACHHCNLCLVLPNHALLLQIQHWFEVLEIGSITHLELSVGPMNERMLQCVAQCLQGAQQMQMVRLTAMSEYEDGWEQGVLGMPRRGQYEFPGPHIPLTGDLDEVGRMLGQRGFTVESCDVQLLKFKYAPVATGGDNQATTASPQ